MDKLFAIFGAVFRIFDPLFQLVKMIQRIFTRREIKKGIEESMADAEKNADQRKIEDLLGK